MTHRNERVLSVKELSPVEGEGGLYLRAGGGRVEEARLDIYKPPRFFEAFLRSVHLLLGALPGPDRRKIII